MYTNKDTGPVVLIIVTSMVLYALVRSKKLNYLGQNWRHHLITPSMKARKRKSIIERELKRTL